MRKTGEERSDSRSAGGLQAMLTKDRETNESRNIRMHGISAAQQLSKCVSWMEDVGGRLREGGRGQVTTDGKGTRSAFCRQSEREMI